jgi:hypothetical protein
VFRIGCLPSSCLIVSRSRATPCKPTRDYRIPTVNSVYRRQVGELASRKFPFETQNRCFKVVVAQHGQSDRDTEPEDEV